MAFKGYLFESARIYLIFIVQKLNHLISEKTITLCQAYGLISGGKISRGKKEISFRVLVDNL